MKVGKKLTKKEIKELVEQLPKLENNNIWKDKEYHCVCDNCGYGWYAFNVLDEDDELLGNVYCPNCLSGEIYTFDENDDNF